MNRTEKEQDIALDAILMTEQNYVNILKLILTEEAFEEQTKSNMKITTEELVEWSDGNIGGLNFLMMLNKQDDTIIQSIIHQKLKQCNEIRGWKLWVLFNDLCERDLYNVALLALECTDERLTDVCSRQDRSGKLITQPILERLAKEYPLR